jgi:hypothetical protein
VNRILSFHAKTAKVYAKDAKKVNGSEILSEAGFNRLKILGEAGINGSTGQQVNKSTG